MFVTDHPSWAAYKAALTRFAEASARLEDERTAQGSDLRQVEQDYEDALLAFEASRDCLERAGGPACVPPPLPRAWSEQARGSRLIRTAPEREGQHGQVGGC